MLVAEYTNVWDLPGVFQFFGYIFGHMGYDISGLGLINDVQDAINGSLIGDMSQIWTYAETIIDSIRIYAMVLMVIYFLCDVLDKATREMLTVEVFIRDFIKLIIGYSLMLNCFTILNVLFSIGNGFTDIIAKNITGTDMSTDELLGQVQLYCGETLMNQMGYEDVKYVEVGGVDALVDIARNFSLWINHFNTSAVTIFRLICQQLATNLIPWLIAKTTWLICIVIALGRLLDIGVRTALAPIAIADIFHSGPGGAGFKYIKKIFAVGLQGAVILTIILLIGAGSGALEGDLVETIGNMGINPGWEVWRTVLFRLAGTTLIVKSQSIASEIVGA